MRARITYAAVAALTAAVVGCTTHEQAPRHAAATAAAPTAVTIHARDFAYTMPDSVPAGYVGFTLVNDGPSLHHATIFRLDSGKTMSDLVDALKHPGPLPTWAVPQGGPNAPAPGLTSNATLNLTPGNYAVLCMVDVPGGVPHFMKGMMHAFVVTPSLTATAAPVADDTIRLREYAFEFAKPLTSGHHTFAVTDVGAQPHELELVKLDSGKTATELLAWLNAPKGPPPGTPLGGIAFTAPGNTDYFTADLTSGNYLLICFVPDAKDGKPHFMHGMMLTQTVN